MLYQRFRPSPHLVEYIKEFWIIDSGTEIAKSKQKIIPDGYPELIFHYKDPYSINISGNWQMQTHSLVAGQIRNHFFLENTGQSGMIGVKMMPTSMTKLFGISMNQLTDSVVDIHSLASVQSKLATLPKPSLQNKEAFIQSFEQRLQDIVKADEHTRLELDLALAEIFKSHGILSISKLCKKMDISERQLERQFSKYVGLSPKFYARIIRFSYIFELMQNSDNTWSDLVYQSGFYDQSHFIKNFKEFTGEDPTSYGFDERNMANFHLKK